MTLRNKGRMARTGSSSGKPTWAEPGEEAKPATPATPEAAPRNCAGKVEHKYIAERMLEAGIAAFEGDQLQYGKLQQALTYAGRLAKANWRQYVAEQTSGAAGQQGKEAA